MSYCTLDIETLPSNDAKIIEQIRDSISPPGTITKDETKLKWLEQNLEAETEKALRKTGLDALYGQILSIAWAIDDGEVNCLYRSSYDDSEADLLKEFFLQLSSTKDEYGHRVGISKWVGHNSCAFDFRFIWQRCVINGIQPSVKWPNDAKPWDSNVFDTRIAWTGAGQYQGRSSLDALSSVMFGEGKGEVTGATVFDFFMRGEIDKIVSYNKQDVEMTRKLYKRMNFIT